jgi:hypothetical protein
MSSEEACKCNADVAERHIVFMLILTRNPLPLTPCRWLLTHESCDDRGKLVVTTSPWPGDEYFVWCWIEARVFVQQRAQDSASKHLPCVMSAQFANTVRQSRTKIVDAQLLQLLVGVRAGTAGPRLKQMSFDVAPSLQLRLVIVCEQRQQSIE